MSKATYTATCDPAKVTANVRLVPHDFSRSRVEPAAEFGGNQRRVVFCSFCGAERRRATA